MLPLEDVLEKYKKTKERAKKIQEAERQGKEKLTMSRKYRT